jgi:hypothetical protein
MWAEKLTSHKMYAIKCKSKLDIELLVLGDQGKRCLRGRLNRVTRQWLFSTPQQSRTTEILAASCARI